MDDPDIFEVARDMPSDDATLQGTTVGAPLGSDEPLVQSGEVACPARFRILRRHAEGGLGVIHVAEDRDVGREVAFKQIREDHSKSPAVRDKFTREATLTGRLEHPGIVPIYALGADAEGSPFYAMRFIRGESLRDAIRDAHAAGPGRTPPPVVLNGLLRRFLDVCDAIAYAHDRAVLHRDLKPGNVMLGRHGETLVVDWGLAKPLGESQQRPSGATPRVPANSAEPPISYDESLDSGSQTRRGDFLGTIAYAPPEQLRGDLDQLCPASDVYSLGAILFEVLTGQPPLSGVGSPEEAVRHINTRQVPVPKSVASGVPFGLNAICAKAMQPRIEDRYSSAELLGQDIGAWLDDLPVSAAREPLPLRARRWIRNHPRLISVTLATVLISVFGFAAHSLVVSHKNQQLEIAFERTDRALGLAMESIDSVLTRFAVDPRAAGDGLAESQLASIRQAADNYRQLLDVFEGNPELGGETARVLRFMSLATANMGEIDSALDYAREANRLLAESGGLSPEDNLARAQIKRFIGYLNYLKGEFAASKESHQEGIAILDELSESRPDDPAIEFEYAVALTYLGEAQGGFAEASGTQAGDALKSFAESEQRFAGIPADQRVLVNRPEEPGAFGYFRGMNMMNLALGTFVAMKSLPEARELFDKAEAIYSDLTQRYPNLPHYQSRKLRLETNWIAVLQMAGQREAATELNGEGLAAASLLWRRFPYSIALRDSVAMRLNTSLIRDSDLGFRDLLTQIDTLGDVLAERVIPSPATSNLQIIYRQSPSVARRFVSDLSNNDNPQQVRAGLAVLAEFLRNLETVEFEDREFAKRAGEELFPALKKGVFEQLSSGLGAEEAQRFLDLVEG